MAGTLPAQETKFSLMEVYYDLSWLDMAYEAARLGKQGVPQEIAPTTVYFRCFIFPGADISWPEAGHPFS